MSTEVHAILYHYHMFLFTYVPYQSSGLLQVLYKYIVDSQNVSTESSGLLHNLDLIGLQPKELKEYLNIYLYSDYLGPVLGAST